MNKNQSGATILEFSLVVGVVLLFLFSIIDISLYFHAKSTMREVARRLTAEAVVDNDFALDTRSFTNPAIQPSAQVKDKITNARKRIIEKATSVAKASILAPSLEDGSVEYLYSSEGYKNPGANSIALSSLLLRPGERAKVVYKKKDGQEVTETIVHPNCVTNDPNSAICKSYLAKPGSDAWDFMQRNIPYYVEVRGKVKTILLGEIEVKAKSVAWKDIAKTNEKSDFVQIPTPLTCSEAYPNPNQLCTLKCGAPDACDFLAGNTVSQGCYTCKTCKDFTTAEQACSSCGGANGDSDETCNFNPNGTNANSCGGCQAKIGTCKEFANPDQVCSACGGADGNTTHECQFNENNQITAGGSTTSCGQCVPKISTCQEITSANEVCSECGGEQGNATEECIFKSGQPVPVGQQGSKCGGCEYRGCTEVFSNYTSGEIDDTQASQISECKCNLETHSCVFNGSKDYNQGCFGCAAKTCSDFFTTQQALDYCKEFQLNNPGKECTFKPNTAGKNNCFNTPWKLCKNRYTAAEIEQYCNEYKANNPGKECVFDPNSRAQNCFGGRDKYCSELYTAEEKEAYCKEYELNNPDKTCIFYGSKTSNCFGGQLKTCEERIQQGTIDFELVCAEQCDSKTQECVAVTGAKSSCVSCKPKTCEQANITKEQVCGNCGFGQECNYDANALVGNCGSCQACPAVECKEVDGLVLDDSGCGCKSCRPTECPNPDDIIVGCQCVPNTPN